MDTTNVIPVRLLGKDFKISCPIGKEQDLLDAAYQLNQEMCKIKAKGRVLDTESIAVMAALNATYQLTSQQIKNQITSQEINFKLQDLQDKIDNVLVKKTSSSHDLLLTDDLDLHT